MTETTVGREPIQIVELVQPLCANTYGSAPCTASGGADAKCYNTRATCQDTANYDGSSSLSLYFAKGYVAERGVSGAPYIIPSLKSVSTAPTVINLGAANQDAQGLGNRALCTITFTDHPHTDRRVDPYVDGRSWNPLDRASFWSKWIVRNKFWNLIRINIYEGYSGQALGSMTKRTYFMDNITGPDDQGRVTIQGKDVLARIEERKAQAPVISEGVLYADITDSDLTFEVANAVEADYDASGVIRINDELILYTSRATSTNGVQFTCSIRGYKNSVSDEHSADDEVQQCVVYENGWVNDVLEDLLTTYGGIPGTFLDTTNWETEVRFYSPAVRLNTIISEPTDVSLLVSEILEQVGAFMWWDERNQLVKYKSVRGVEEEATVTFTAENHILPGLRLERKPRRRISQAWFYYGIRSYVEELEKPSNFNSSTIVADLDSESDDQYGEPSIRKIFSRWLLTAAGSNATAARLVKKYRDVPLHAIFEVDAKDRDTWAGDVIFISHHLLVDDFGERKIERWTVLSAEETVPGEKVKYTCENTNLYGIVYLIQDSAVATDPYTTPTDIGFNLAYIGNSSGELSDGTEAAKIG